MKRFYFFLMVIVFSIACRKDKNAKESEQKGPQQIVKFFKSNSRGVVASYSVDPSLAFEYYGKFDASGNTLNISSFNVQSNEVLATYVLDEDYRLRQLIYSKNGVKENLFYSFGYNGDTLLVSLVQHTWGKSNDAVLLRTVKFAFQNSKPIKANVLQSTKSVPSTSLVKTSQTQNDFNLDDFDELKNGIAPLLQSPGDYFSSIVNKEKKKFIEKSQSLAIKALKLTEYVSCSGTLAGLITVNLPAVIIAAPICIFSKEINNRIEKKIVEPNIEMTTNNDWQQDITEPPLVITPPAVATNNPPKESEIEDNVQDIRKSYDFRTILLSKKWLRMRPGRTDTGYPYIFSSNGTLIVRDILRITQWNGTWAISGGATSTSKTYLHVFLPYEYSYSTWNEISVVTAVSFEEIQLQNGTLIAY
ncbi:hypothetical protein [Pedobacter heparinus]|uniref:hypothetical protein n=1 Tax=Pedobacter heparinus TaxID=984 RepID=UPI00292CF7AB|nr:hypothetical protein [Pedobacter heparinus]